MTLRAAPTVQHQVVVRLRALVPEAELTPGDLIILRASPHVLQVPAQEAGAATTWAKTTVVLALDEPENFSIETEAE